MGDYSDGGDKLVAGKYVTATEGERMTFQPVELAFIESEFGLSCTECGCMVGDRDTHAHALHAGRPTRIVKP